MGSLLPKTPKKKNLQEIDIIPLTVARGHAANPHAKESVADHHMTIDKALHIAGNAVGHHETEVVTGRLKINIVTGLHKREGVVVLLERNLNGLLRINIEIGLPETKAIVHRGRNIQIDRLVGTRTDHLKDTETGHLGSHIGVLPARRKILKRKMLTENK